MIVLETERLILRHVSENDAEFILELVNQPSFLRFIGDKGVRTLDDARQYIRKGLVESYDRHGFGLYLVVLRATGVSIGMCGFVRREGLDFPDIGFALHPAYWSQGYATESAAAVLAHGRAVLGLTRVLAITSPDNVDSIALLEKLGLRFSKMIRIAGDAADVKLFDSALGTSPPGGTPAGAVP